MSLCHGQMPKASGFGHGMCQNSDTRASGRAVLRHDYRRTARTRGLGELRLLGVDDVHDHAALEHLGQADFEFHLFIVLPHWFSPLRRDVPVERLGSEAARRAVSTFLSAVFPSLPELVRAPPGLEL